MYYNKKLQADNQFLIVDGLGQVIQTHLSTPFRPLSEHTADLLCQDLNDIHAKNALTKSKEASNTKLNNKLRESFGYCLLSTIFWK